MKTKLSFQSGAVLIFSLLMLLLITLMGTSMVQQNRMQFLMAANMQLQSQAFSKAENALLLTEEYIDSQRYTDKPNFVCQKTAGVFTQLPIANNIKKGAKIDTTKSNITNNVLGLKTSCPECTVEITKTVCFSTETNVSEDCSVNTSYTDPLTGIANYTYCYSNQVKDCATELYTLKATVVDSTNVSRVVEARYGIQCDS